MKSTEGHRQVPQFLRLCIQIRRQQIFRMYLRNLIGIHRRCSADAAVVRTGPSASYIVVRAHFSSVSPLLAEN